VTEGPRFLAIDAGGTSTRSVVVAADGSCLGYGRAGGGNPISRGLDAAMDAVRQSSAVAIAMAGVRADRIAGAVIAMAGMGIDAPLDGPVAEAMRQLGISSDVHMESDVLAAFESGTTDPSGYVLLAGTGAAALRIEDRGVTGTVDGLGWLIGDVGSGVWIGRRVVMAAAEHLDRRGPTTALTPLLLDAMGIDTALQLDDSGRPAALTDMLVAVYRDLPIQLARFAQLAFITDDPVAERIVAEAGDALASTLWAVMAPDLDGPVVATGGVLAGQPRLRQSVVDGMADRGRSVQLDVVLDGLAGAAVLALRHAGLRVDVHVHDRVRRTLAATSGAGAVPLG
jgi:N-acetylglucosamine kinase-like BadF-type ATPase